MLRITVRQLRQVILSEIVRPFASRNNRKFVVAVVDALGLEFREYLGAGAYSTAYLARDQTTGEDRVVKISDEAGEFLPYEKVRLLRRTLPPELAKHLPVIHSSGKLKSDPRFRDLVSEFERTDSMTVVVMEPLRRLPDQVRAQLFNAKPPRTDAELHDISKILVDKMFKYDGGENLLPGNLQPDVLVNKLTQIIKTQTSGMTAEALVDRAHYMSRQVWDQFRAEIRKLLPQQEKTRFYETFGNVEFGFTGSLAGMFHMGEISAYAPKGHQATNISAQGANLKRVFSVLKTAGLHPADTHAGNLMIRPSTGDVVLSDVGLFGEKS